CRKRQTGGAGLGGIGAGEQSIRQHADVGHVKLLAVGRQRHGEGQAAHRHRGHHQAGARVDHGYALVRLVDGVEDVAREVEGQFAGEAVVKTTLVDVDDAASFVVGVEQADASRVSLGDIDVV